MRAVGRVRSSPADLTIGLMGLPSAPASTPHAEYTRRLEGRRLAAEHWRRRSSVLSNLRLAVFAAGVVVAFAIYGAEKLHGSWLLAVAAVFVALMVLHDRQLRRLRVADRAVAFYESGLARLEGRWMGGGEPGERFRDARHPYSEDLDLFGAGSLFELLCIARTRAGETTLAAWLSAPGESQAVRERQRAVAELARDLDLREEMSLLGTDVAAGMHPEALRAWGDEPAVPGLRSVRLAAAGCSALTVTSLAAWLLAGVGPIPLEIMLVVQSFFAIGLRRRVRRVLGSAEEAGRDLAVFSQLVSRLEAEEFETPVLKALQATLMADGEAASKRIARLRLLLDLLDARRNQLFAPFGALGLWTTQLALAVESWHAASGPALGAWIDAAGEAEALLCLAGFRYENPGSCFPEIAAGPALFDGRALGHPLLPRERCVTNDVRLGGELQLLVVSGSNMSGKSTLLRTVGTNAVLALAGAPVPAESLRISPLTLAASIRIQDSLLEGSSQFYAEIQRLRQIMGLAEEEPPVLFLVDEILHGTNSHDRGIGAEAVVRGFVERGAVGLVTTHDLALAKVADALGPRATNVHFQDHLEAGSIAFDYRLWPGVVEKSNALELMRAVGLDV
jgi:hypothetical protein